MKTFLLQTTYIIETILLLIWILLCRILGIKLSSKIGGKLAESIGPITKFDEIATNNLQKVFPKLNTKIF